MQPNNFSQPTGAPGGLPGQPEAPPQPYYGPAPRPVTPGGPVQAPYSPELAAQLIGRPIMPGGPAPLPSRTPQYTAAPRQPYAASPYVPNGQPTAPTAASQYFAAAPQQSAPAAPALHARLITWLAVSLLLLLVGLGGYWYLTSKDHTKAPAKTAPVARKTASLTADLGSLSSFTLLAPADDQLTGLTAQSADVTTRLATYTSSDKSCTLGFGMEPAGIGTAGDVNAVVAAKLAAAKKEDPNIRVTGPSKAAALQLKADNGKTYALPMLSFAFTDAAEGGGTLAETYATYQTSYGGHAVAYALCQSDTPNQQSVLTGKVNALWSTAQKITIKTK